MFNKTRWKRQNKRKKRWWLSVYKQSYGCKKCQGSFEDNELEIHHIDPTTKEIRPTHMVRDEWSIERMLGELDKCIVLCKTCHLEEHKRPTFGMSGTYID